MAICGSSGPVTLAGTLAQENAEILAGVVISQLLAPGLPVTYWGIPHILDPATANMVFGGPEQGLMAAAITQLGKSYGLPVGVNVGLTDAKIPDAQAGLEKGMTLLMGALAGADIFGHMGIAGMDQGSCLAQLVIDNEMMGHMRRTLKGVTVSDHTLALDVIREVGIGGHFLAEEHTARSFRDEFFFPRLCDRNQWEPWIASGGTTMLERAIALEERLATTHQVAPPEEAVVAEIDAIVARARRTLCAM
jgi:trimethylamine--corrinoid protein Co-methyltransferase